jgi:protocatechuate 3,4-dioxygenase beta subunit
LLNIISSINSGLGDLANTTRNAIVTVTNINPEIDTLVASSQYGTGFVSLSGTYHDVGSQDTHTISINWGEGGPETVTVTGGTFTITHQYANPSLNPSTTYTTGFNSKDATFLNSSFSGVAFHDVNRDGLLNGLEGPAPSRFIYLDSNNNSVLDTGEEFHITDAYGNFAFNNLPAGTYHIREVPIAHWVQTTPDIEFSVGSGETLTSGRVGNFRLANISGIKFNDFNGDGVNSPGEMGMPGWTIFIDSNSNGTLDTGEVSQTTDAFGAYHFDDLEAGSYTIREVQQAGWTLTSTNPAPFAIVPNLSLQEAWSAFGNFKYAKVSGGVLFNDGNGNGTRDPGEAGIGGRTVYIDLDNDGVRDPGEASTITDTNGNWGFDNLTPGNYVIREETPTGWVSTGAPVTITVSQSGQTDIGGNLGSRINTGSLSGFVWVDANDNGDIDLNEKAIANVTIELTYRLNSCHTYTLTTTTDENGFYEFTNLQPGTYQIREIQPAGYLDGRDEAGSLGGCLSNDRISNIDLDMGDIGVNYNFGERNAASYLHEGQTATIGFWHNKNGQALIKSLNGSANSTALGNWLASNFGNLYGSSAGANNLTNKTNAQVAAYFLNLFGMNGQKLQAQVLAVALASYVTDSDLAGTVARQYGFQVNSSGTASALFNIGSNGAAFGVANNTTMSIFDILRATNARSSGGVLYKGIQNLKNLANTVYDGINNTGDI